MSAELPDDPARWPHDPFAALGLPPGSDERAVKRAYAALLRRFRPETHPLQFQRLREVYEAALARLQWYRPEPELNAPAPFVPLTGVPDPWDAALAGDFGAAYRDLRAGPRRADDFVRLYWLLRLNPDLDPGREPADWLTAGLTAHGWGGTLRTLYRAELTARPTEALAPRCVALLAHLDEPAAAAELAALRWRVAARLNRWDAAAADRNTLRERFRRDELAWVELLGGLFESLCFAGDPVPKLRHDCGDELRSFQYLALRRPDLFDRLDAARWRGQALARVSLRFQPLKPLLDLWRRGEPTALPTALPSLTAEIARRPAPWLGWLHELRQADAGCFADIADWLHTAADGVAEPRPAAATATAAARFLAGQRGEVYAKLRPIWLRACIDEWLDPAWLYTDAPGDWPPRVRWLAEHSASDAPLGAVCAAVRFDRRV